MNVDSLVGLLLFLFSFCLDLGVGSFEFQGMCFLALICLFCWSEGFTTGFASSETLFGFTQRPF